MRTADCRTTGSDMVNQSESLELESETEREETPEVDANLWTEL